MLFLFCAAQAQSVSGAVDLHIHLAAHLAVPVYGIGPEATPPAHPSNLHSLQPQIFLEDLEKPGPSILVSLAYADPFLTVLESHASMSARIQRQLDYVEAFGKKHADHFGVAHTPSEARNILASGRTVIVQGIEGATKILENPEDARHWAEEGVAVVTPIHLSDNSIGGAWCQEGFLRVLNLPGCRLEKRDPGRHGLKDPDRIGDLLDAGIVVDLAHMSHQSFADTIAILAARGRPPVYSHVIADAIRQDSIALTDSEFAQIQALHGLVGVTPNLSHLRPRPLPDLPPSHCPNTLDDFRLQWDYIVHRFAGDPVAWGSDFQGGIDHLGPRFGPRGCADSPVGRPLLPFDTQGLSSPAMVEPLFAQLSAEGSDIRPLQASAQRFLEIWETNWEARVVVSKKTGPPSP
jgi:microsomal dipeptidase-like Zn-dependent dipeptidase